MSDDESPSSGPGEDPSAAVPDRDAGPLDELVPGLRQPREPVPYAPVHARVLRIDEMDGASLGIACWEDPGGPVALYRALQARVEAALLAELSRPAKQLRERTTPWRRLRLAVFADVAPSDQATVADAVRAFAMTGASPRDPDWRWTLAHMRHEAQQLPRPVADEPVSCWEAVFRTGAERDATRGEMLEQGLIEATGDEVWGEHPGVPFRRLADALQAQRGVRAQAPLGWLREAEPHLVLRHEGAIRWIPPLVFQALCDAVGVAAQLDLGQQVQWGVCEPDESGIAPPPLLRVQRSGGFEHVPVGLALLRWCIMPLQPQERVPPLADWVADQFGPRRG